MKLTKNGLTAEVKFEHWLVKLIRRFRPLTGAVTFLGTIRVGDATIAPALLLHEWTHIEQQHDLGAVKFAVLYFVELCRHGYYNNRFEVQAYARQYDPFVVKDWPGLSEGDDDVTIGVG